MPLEMFDELASQVQATTHWESPLDKTSLVTNQLKFLVGTSDTVVGVEKSKTLAAAIPGLD